MKVCMHWMTDRAVVGLAVTGCAFDPNDPMYQASDAPRYACWIQAARDRKDYAEADRIRAMAVRFGCRVQMDKAQVTVFDGRDEEWETLAPPMPDFSGYREWVEPRREAGRKVIDLSYVMGGQKRVASIAVANWDDHPNLALAQSIGLPDALWSATGQQTLDNMISTDWFDQQWEAIRLARVRLGMSIASRSADVKREGGE